MTILELVCDILLRAGPNIEIFETSARAAVSVRFVPKGLPYFLQSRGYHSVASAFCFQGKAQFQVSLNAYGPQAGTG